MRIRTIKPEWLEDELLAGASDAARVLSVALILMADDYGCGRASLAEVAMQAWRFDMSREDGAKAPETLARASRALRELSDMGFVVLYSVGGQRYFAIRTWEKHQKVDHRGKRRIPVPPSEDAAPSESLATDSRESRETLAPDLGPRTPTVGPRTGTEEGARAARRVLVRAYSEAWKRETRSDWIPSQHAPHLDELAAWLDGAYPDPAARDAATARLVKAIFAHAPYRKLSWKLGFVLQDGPQVVMDRASASSAAPDDFSNTPSIEERFHG
jgi:hypothetical protein